MRIKPLSDENSKNQPMTLHYPVGSGHRLQGQNFNFFPGQLTRIVTDGPAGASLLLEALSEIARTESSSLSDLRWPTIPNESEAEPIVSGMAPCLLVSQNRFFCNDPRHLAGLYGLNELVEEYLRSNGDTERCPSCSENLIKPEIPALAELLLARVAPGTRITVSAPLAGSNQRERQKMKKLGFHRYWLNDRLADDEDIDESDLWEKVDAVLIDMIKTDETAAGRIVEALVLASQIGAETVWIGIGGEQKKIGLKERLCPTCLETFKSQSFAPGKTLYPDADCLSQWLRDTGKTTLFAGDLDLRRLFSLLKAFSLSSLPLSTGLPELGWISRGAALMIRAVSGGAPNRFVLMDAPFWGLHRGEIEVIRQTISETLEQEWGWIVAGDDDCLSDLTDRVIHLSSESGNREGDLSKREKRTDFAPLQPDWNCTIGCKRYPEVHVGSGQWKRFRAGSEFDSLGEAVNWSISPDTNMKGIVPTLKTAGHHQAFRLTNSRRQTFAGYLEWDRMIAERMALLPGSRARGMTVRKILGRQKTEMCMTCRGLGVSSDASGWRADPPCGDCGGVGGRFDAAAPRYRGLTLYDIMKLTVQKAAELFTSPPRLRYALDAAERSGFNEIVFCRRLWTLSESERWLLVVLSKLILLHDRPGILLVEQPFLSLSAKQKKSLETLFGRYTESGGALVTLE